MTTKLTIIKLANKIILAVLVVFFLLGVLYKHIPFGLGLGDMIVYFFIFIVIIVHFGLIKLISTKGFFLHLILAVFFYELIHWGLTSKVRIYTL
jgi:hypothetical protein